LPVLSFVALVSCQSQAPNAAGTAASPLAKTGVAALGRLEPREPVTEVGVASEERLEKLLVQPGQFVKAGEILAYLENYHYRLAERQKAAAELAEAEARLSAEEEQGRARIQEAQSRTQQLDEVPQREVESEDARVRELRTNMDLASSEVTRYRTLLAKDAVSQQDYDQKAAGLDAASAALEAGQAQLARLKAQMVADRRVAQAGVVTRQAELKSTQGSSTIASLKGNLEVAEAELQKTIIRANSAGQVIEILSRPGEPVNGHTILRMGDVSQMYVAADVFEGDVSRVQVGQRAEISSPALPGALTGHVESIGTSVFRRQVRVLDPQADVDTRVVNVRIRLDHSQEAARLVGLQVSVLIPAPK
jgi:HlyD family secretion protein